jgi:hypothetical protein
VHCGRRHSWYTLSISSASVRSVRTFLRG